MQSSLNRSTEDPKGMSNNLQMEDFDEGKKERERRIP
jgi:hypothetical protein